jgi:hypothetical protein
VTNTFTSVVPLKFKSHRIVQRSLVLQVDSLGRVGHHAVGVADGDDEGTLEAEEVDADGGSGFPVEQGEVTQSLS